MVTIKEIAEEPICPKCGSDDIECSDNCNRHKCVQCGYILVLDLDF